MDRKTVIAVALCLVVLIAYPFLLKTFGLDRYLRPAEPPRSAAVDSLARDSSGVLPPPGVTPASPRAASPSAASSPASALAGGSNAQLSATPFATPSSELERSVHIETPLYRAEFSSRGARLLSFELKHYASAHGAWTSDPTAKRPKPGKIVPSEDRVALAASPAFGVDLGSGPGLRSLGNVVYAVAESLDAAGETRVLTFTARDSAGMAVQQTWRVRADDYALDLEVSVRGVPAGLHVSDYSLTSRSWPLVYEANSQDESRSLQATSLVGDNLHREGPGGLRKGEKRFEGNVVWAVVNTRYFLGGVAPVRGAARAAVASTESRTLTAAQLRVLPAGTRPEQDIAVSALVMALPGESESSHHFLVYFGPKEYFRLIKLGSHWERVVDLGWSWIVPVSKVLLRLLVWLYRIVQNYGVAILVVATIVRVLLHPLNMMSMKSMRAMTRLQPEMDRLKERHKNDAQALNTAVMALYKDNKVNPAGGCLPMLMQMPLFIALYSVLYNAIELRQAPFVGWIHDLSAPDLLFSVAAFPIRLLPVLMAGSGLLTSKLTPSAPGQAMNVYVMNLVMTVFFYNLPSGLVLYWTVMNLLTALQQWMVLREDVPVIGTVPVAATTSHGRTVAKKAAEK